MIESGTKETKPQGRRYGVKERERALDLVAAGAKVAEAARLLGTTSTTVFRWRQEAAATKAKAGAATDAVPDVEPAQSNRHKDKAEKPEKIPRSPYAPLDPAQGLGEHEIAAILELKQRHPSMGPAQLRAQLKRFKGWRVSLKAIARVLRGHGYEPVHRGPPKGPEPIRFEAPRRNALWQADYTEVRVGDDRLHVLVILDDFSRYIVGHALADAPTSAVATRALQAAIARHGKPEALRTDRGGAFVAFTKETDFGRYLERELIDHSVGRAYSPRGGGKVEAANGTLKRELWEVEHFTDRHEAEKKLAAFFADYNERRAHMGLDGLTPADRYFGRADQVLAVVDAVSRKRQGALSRLAPGGAPTEENGTGAPLEVLRLVIVDGVMELRFCGARVVLGRVTT